MPKKIVIIDYGMGNLGSVRNALRHLGQDSVIVSSPSDIDNADAIILPGVGAFGKAMDNLRSRGMVEPLTRNAIERKRPFLGICLGMQLIAKDSEEMGFHEGLGWIEGSVKRLDVPARYRLPHIGWNNIELCRPSPLFEGIGYDRNFYFVHSYNMVCGGELVDARCDYGVSFVASVRKGNIFATQFHPEKSHENGLKVLDNFVRYVASC